MLAEKDLNGIVLVIDDEPESLRSILDRLSDHGLDVIIATEGSAAIDHAEKTEPDLILLDTIMPGIDGFETCRLIKERETLRDIPVIFMTKLSGTTEKLKIFQSGAVDTITKPIDDEEFLARVSAHLTIRRLQRDLRASNNKLRELYVLKNEFLGMAAHDIKNPLAQVLMCAELIEVKMRNGVSDGLARHVQKIIQGALKIDALISNLLEVNAIDSGERIFRIVPADLTPIVQQSVEDHTLAAAAKSIELVVEIGAGDKWGCVDTFAAQQIIDNVLSNAIKYSPRQKTVWARIRTIDSFTEIEIEDQGPGISDDERQQLYQKFSRLSPQPTGGESSTGLGLWIVNQLLEAMKGTIDCDSKVGSGSRFVLRFPSAPKEADCAKSGTATDGEEQSA